MSGTLDLKPKKLTGYHLDHSTTIACQLDQRFSYCTYAPREIATRGGDSYRIVVAVHGSDRDFHELRESFADLADRENLIILAPLFPSGIEDTEDHDNYKYILYRGIRFDQILLAMVDEVVQRFGLKNESFYMFGFSGGAHFAHRFLYLHPERLSAVSVAAPGSVTLIDESQDWWVGTGNIKEVFGLPFRLDIIRQVPVQLLIGDNDLITDAITHSESSPHWMPGANSAGKTRIDRLETLRDNFTEYGLDVQFECIPGVGHEASRLVEGAKDFFSRLMQTISEKQAV